MQNRMFVYRPAPVSASEFVAYWSPLYGEKDSELDERLYFPNINGPHTVESLEALFLWKIGYYLYNKHMPGVRDNFIKRMGVARALSPDTTPAFFLNKVFPDGGAIYRIFWLHCWFPQRFPIYDQHVHRAMIFIQEGRIEELGTYNDARKIDTYLNRFLAFSSQFSAINERSVDRALFAFGKFIKDSDLPLPP